MAKVNATNFSDNKILLISESAKIDSLWNFTFFVSFAASTSLF